MSAAIGKIAPASFRAIVGAHLGARRDEVLVGPRPGTDAAIVRVGAGRVLALTTDPLSIVPAVGAEGSAWLAAHLLASDLWTSGLPPAWAAVDLNLPPGMSDEELAVYWRALSDAFAELDVAVVAGHTGRYHGCELPIVGACTLAGVGDETRTVGPDFVRPGDRVLLTKGCAIEAGVIAAHLFPTRLAARLAENAPPTEGAPGGAEVAAAARALDRLSVVPDCRAALRVGVRDHGVSALHDATEGGVLGGLVELAQSCGHDLRVERARIATPPEARAACDLLGIDPAWTLSEGSLIASVRPSHLVPVMAALMDEGIPAAEVGEVVKGDGGVWLTEPDGSVRHLTEPEPDPWWEAYERAVREGWE